MNKGRLRVIVGSLMTIVLAGCQSNSNVISKSDGRGVTALFEGFAYRGVKPQTVTTDLDRGRVVPEAIVSGKEYLFNRQADGQAEIIALETLPTRLHALGFEVLSGPKPDGTGFIFLDTGGPPFLIKARKGDCILSIEKTTATEISGTRQWPWDRVVWEAGSYVLSVIGTGGGL